LCFDKEVRWEKINPGILYLMPLELIESGFEELANDKNFIYHRHNRLEKG